VSVLLDGKVVGFLPVDLCVRVEQQLRLLKPEDNFVPPGKALRVISVWCRTETRGERERDIFKMYKLSCCCSCA